MSDSSEKELPASARKLRKARERGEVASSQEFVSALTFTAAGGAVISGLPQAIALVRGMFDRAVLMAQGDMPFDPVFTLASLASGILSLLAMPMAVILGAAILSNVLIKQGLPASLEPLMPKFSRISPMSGFKNMFSMNSLVSMAMALAKFSAWTAASILTVWAALPSILASGACGAGCILDVAGKIIITMAITAIVIIIIGGAADLPLQIFMFLKNQRMSKEEVKKEYEENEGKPEIKMHRRQIAHEIATAPPLPKEGLAAASAIVTDGEKCVALMFRPGVDEIPIVLSRGQAEKAADMLARGGALGLLIERDAELARGLYKKHQPGDVIQQEFYQPVALLLVRAPRGK